MLFASCLKPIFLLSKKKEEMKSCQNQILAAWKVAQYQTVRRMNNPKISAHKVCTTLQILPFVNIIRLYAQSYMYLFYTTFNTTFYPTNATLILKAAFQLRVFYVQARKNLNLFKF